MPVGRNKALAIVEIRLVFVLVLGALLASCGGTEDEQQVASSNAVVVIRVSGTQGTSYTGAYGPFEQAQRVDGILGAGPTDYEVEVGSSNGVRAVFRKTEPGDEGTLRVQILADGAVVDEDETSADLGVVTSSWSPQGETTVEHPGER
jgi:hypothetical protein